MHAGASIRYMTRARMCDIWLAACVLRWGRGFFPGARARTQIRAQPRLRYCRRHALHPASACRHLEHPNLVGCRAAVAALAAFVAAIAAEKRSFTRPLRSGRKDASFMISDTLLVKLALFFVGAAAAAAGAAAAAAAGLRISTTHVSAARPSASPAAPAHLGEQGSQVQRSMRVAQRRSQSPWRARLQPQLPRPRISRRS